MLLFLCCFSIFVLDTFSCFLETWFFEAKIEKIHLFFVLKKQNFWNMFFGNSFLKQLNQICSFVSVPKKKLNRTTGQKDNTKQSLSLLLNINKAKECIVLTLRKQFWRKPHQLGQSLTQWFYRVIIRGCLIQQTFLWEFYMLWIFKLMSPMHLNFLIL